ncbi:hypothetical protein B0H11DRAFT_2206648 [Mycena galericulata]|nr:hypothetical protein B0H11DRAFT_2206648 [Mycena galericulata]
MTRNAVRDKLCQWMDISMVPSAYTATVSMDRADQEIMFLPNEHWMMLFRCCFVIQVKKTALLFSYVDVAHEIDGASKSDTARVNTQGFKKDVWVHQRERIVTEGTMHKSRQNPELGEAVRNRGCDDYRGEPVR